MTPAAVIAAPLAGPAGPAVRPPGKWELPSRRDPRIPFALLLTLYAAMGCTVLRFNRSPLQMLLIVGATCLFDMALSWTLRRRRLVPLSAYISGVSLALLLNFSHNYYLLFLPMFLTVGSKYLLTFEGRHVYNPSMFGVAASLLIGGDLITTAPAYQWGGTWAMSAFLVMGAVSLFLVRIGRTALIVSFLGFYTLQILLRAWILRWHLPPETLVLGTLSSAPFFLFTFYMITDPQTSPKTPRRQVALAFALTVVDLYLHKKESLYTFFYAAFIVASARFLFLHGRRLWREGVDASGAALMAPATLRAAGLLLAVGLSMAGIYRGLIRPNLKTPELNFRLEAVPASVSGLASVAGGETFALVDPRLRHVAKWVLSVGDAASVGDVNNDGYLDLFLTNPLKRAEDRDALYINLGGLRFERFKVPVLDAVARDPKRYGITASGVFADYDNDGDQDLLLAMGYGKTRLLRNLFVETGRPAFRDDTKASGVDEHTVSVSANFFDFDRDGRLDLFIGNAIDPYLRQYPVPKALSLFDLPKAEYAGDRRMFPIMHSSWDNAENGGPNALYRNLSGGRFQKLDNRAMGTPETHWTIAVGAGDLNGDGWTDLYLASDFGPDDLYLNRRGKDFQRVQGLTFGKVGKDTYKGMNAALGDIDRDGRLDIHVSNVHMPLQAEGSLLWMNRPSQDPFIPDFDDEATLRGALNERRFGWGAALGDLNGDGWLDMVQANGMVDDTLDKKFDRCPDYWYINEKVMRAGPEIHSYADKWGDLRGRCINPRDANRVYLSRGDKTNLQFIDVAPELGWKGETPSRGVLLADLDNDGDLDVAITHMTAPLSLYRNTLREGAGALPGWIGFDLFGDGVSCSRDAAGTKIVLRYQEAGRPVLQLREIALVNSFAAQGDRRALFGLGGYLGPVDASVSWCGGAARLYRGLAKGRYHTLRQELK